MNPGSEPPSGGRGEGRQGRQRHRQAKHGHPRRMSEDRGVTMSEGCAVLVQIAPDSIRLAGSDGGGGGGVVE